MRGDIIKMEKDMIEEVSLRHMKDTINWLVTNTPYRLSGSSDEAKAAEYVAVKMKEYGLETVNEEFYAYNSNPMYSCVEVVSPVKMKMDSLPCAHIKSTDKEGEIFDLVYAGTGDYSTYKDIDARGKMVLVEVSYAPPVPEKARIASEMGAAGIMCMNWGNDEEVICHRGIKAVWGNPTEDTITDIPDIIGVGITRSSGLKLKELCLSGNKVEVRVTAIADRTWNLVHQPKGILRGNGKTDEIMLVCSHLDAWQPGVTCNATGNATALEICRILSKYKNKLDRDIYFTFWNGHEVAEAAGSTWFLDNYWDLLNKKCVSYMHIDSTGVSQTKVFEIKSSGELLDFAVCNAREVLGEDIEIRAMPLKKIGDQSFMGIGIPSVTQRMSFSQEEIEKSHGATLGWWNHTSEDGIDKCDFDILKVDTKVTLSLIYMLATAEFLPYEFEKIICNIKNNVQLIDELYSRHIEFSDIKNNLTSLEEKIKQVCGKKDRYIGPKIQLYNDFVMSLCRIITNVFQTYADKYSQDSYGYTKLSSYIPLLSELEKLLYFQENSLEYGMVKTQLIKNKNRINDALKSAIELSELYSALLR